MENINLYSIAKCCKGKIGIILSIHHDAVGNVLYKGIGFNGEPWQSIKPIRLADNINEYITKTFSYTTN
jgi:hypothetical protein